MDASDPTGNVKHPERAPMRQDEAGSSVSPMSKCKAVFCGVFFVFWRCYPLAPLKAFRFLGMLSKIDVAEVPIIVAGDIVCVFLGKPVLN